MSNKWMIALYVLPAFIIVAVLIYVPIVLTGFYGLMEWNGIGEMRFIGLDNYAKLVQDSMFWRSAYHSFLLAFFSALSLLGYLLVALVLAGRSRAPICSEKFT